ncbi:MAG: hypothetical protein HUU43_07695 [Ignavibacteriaceae bacterium]|nr:hypothetical protein [Ignavibacteriaceae bacterium]
MTLFLSGCSKGPKDTGFTLLDFNDTPMKYSDQINADIYIDATPSMAGFVTDNNSNYINTLSELESVLNTAFKNGTVNFFSFGNSIQKLSRTEYLNCKTPQFYSQGNTFIDSVLSKNDTKKVSIIITDLFQDQRDVNSVVKLIRDSCFAKGLDVGIAGIRSEYNGTVYDALTAPYKYTSIKSQTNSFRPFYMLFIGKEENISKIVETLASKGRLAEENVLLISGRYITKSDLNSVTKDKNDKNISIKRVEEENGTAWVSLNGDAALNCVFDLGFKEFGVYITPENLRLDVYKKEFKDKTWSGNELTNDITSEQTSITGNKLNIKLKLLQSKSNNFISYHSVISINPNSKIELPKWVNEFSSENPNSMNKPQNTLNLDKFIEGLIRGSWAVSTPKIANIITVIKP